LKYLNELVIWFIFDPTIIFNTFKSPFLPNLEEVENVFFFSPNKYKSCLNNFPNFKFCLKFDFIEKDRKKKGRKKKKEKKKIQVVE